jgi:flagellar biogenesis protein FliO
MHCNRLRTPMAALFLSLVLGQAAPAQSRPVANTGAPGEVQFPQIPLRRDSGAGSSIAESAGWAALMLAAVAAAGFFVIRRGKVPGLGKARRWLRPAAGHSAPKALGRTSLTQQASLHVIEWRGEELLLGCTPQSVALLARRQLDPLPEDGSEPGEMVKGQI